MIFNYEKDWLTATVYFEDKEAYDELVKFIENSKKYFDIEKPDHDEDLED